MPVHALQTQDKLSLVSILSALLFLVFSLVLIVIGFLSNGPVSTLAIIFGGLFFLSILFRSKLLKPRHENENEELCPIDLIHELQSARCESLAKLEQLEQLHQTQSKLKSKRANERCELLQAAIDKSGERRKLIDEALLALAVKEEIAEFESILSSKQSALEGESLKFEIESAYDQLEILQKGITHGPLISRLGINAYEMLELIINSKEEVMEQLEDREVMQAIEFNESATQESVLNWLQQMVPCKEIDGGSGFGELKERIFNEDDYIKLRTELRMIRDDIT